MSDLALASLHRADLVRSGTADFVQVARTLALAKGEIGAAERLAVQRRLTPRAAGIIKAGVASITKTAVPAGATDTSTWAAEISAYETIAASFIASLKTFSAFDAMSDSFIQLPLHTKATCTTLGATGVMPEGSTPGETHAVPIMTFEFKADTLRERVSYAMIVETQELLENTTAAAFNKVSTDLKIAVVRAVDTSFLTTIIESTGIVSNAATSDYTGDLATAVTAIDTAANSKVFAVAPPSWVKGAAFARGSGGAPIFPNLSINGGDANGVTVIPSNSLSDTVVVVDAAQCVASSGTVVLDTAGQATLQLDDNPTSGAAQLTSLWLNNLQSIKVRRMWGFELLQSGSAAALITNWPATA